MFNPKHRFQSGFTIVEVMVAMLLGLIMMVGVVSLLVGNKRSFNEQTEMSRLQENARFAVEFLIKDIRMAGYVGCSDDIGKVTNHLDGASDDDKLYNMSNPVEGVDGDASTMVWEPSGSTAKISDMVSGSDGVAIRYLDPLGITLTTGMPLNSAVADVTSNAGLSNEMILAVSDCTASDIFQVTGLPSGDKVQANTGGSVNPGNTTKSPAQNYDAGADVLSFYSARYYIANNADGIPSLYRHTFNTSDATQELVSGIESMQMLFGDGTTYAKADVVSNWDNVNSVKIALLVRTVDEYGTDRDTNTYQLLDKPVDPEDLRVRRKVFNTTVEIRNRS